MKNSERYDRLTRTARDFPRVVSDYTTPGPDGRTVPFRIKQHAPGINAARYDSDQVSGHVVSDPTGNSAGRSQPGDNVLAEVDKLINRITEDVARLVRIADAHPPLRLANEADRLALAKANTRPDPGCTSCERLDSPVQPGTPWWVETDPRHTDATVCPTSGGVPRLDDPMFLCTWCYDFVGAHWRLPSEKELLVHQRGERLRFPVGEEKRTAAIEAARRAWWADTMQSIADQMADAHAQENAEQSEVA